MIKSMIVALLSSGLLGFMAPMHFAEAALVQFQFNGSQTGNPAVTVQALLGIDSSLVAPNGSFNQADLSSFFVQYNGTAFTASSSALPPSLSGQFNNVASGFSSLFANDPLTVPGHSGTNNFQFFGGNGQSWAFGVTGPAPGPLNVQGTGVWMLAPVPIPAAVWLFGSGLASIVGFARRTVQQR
ncbi:hypothetical protein W02_42120 [Nitrospira sp. KM1]|uniref:hypothetical protein n=1 Tax=Nitrospira sp. KM1 TaxID=1936990 RepID=UPI0013A72F79|nr:hypothetical protein [Nitrospira sp. KM1]BCA57072.1 hypothetical protein W02_42120 [Nitrospira sp. KM1]